MYQRHRIYNQFTLTYKIHIKQNKYLPNPIIINSMKSPHTNSKKLLAVQNPTLISNPYSDQPTSFQPKTNSTATINNKPISQMIQIIKNSNKHIKQNPLNEAKGVGHSKSAKKVSLAKIGNFNYEINAKKKQQKGFRNQKFNDYFQAQPKRDKYNTNTSNLSSESNSSVNSIKSESNKNMLFNNIHGKGADKIVTKNIHPKQNPIPKLIKRQSHSIKINNQFNEIFQLNENVKIRALQKMDDKKKSLSSNSFSVIKNNSEGDIKKVISFKKAPTTLTKCSKNPQKICEQPKIAQFQVKPKGVKSQNKIPFIPSASKLRNSQHPKKSIQNNLSKVSQGFKNSIEIPKKEQEKYQLKIKNNSILTSSSQLQQFEVNNIVRLKIVSNSIAPNFASFKIIKKIIKDDKTSIYLVIQLVTKLLYCLKKCLVTPSQSKLEQMKGLNKLQYLIRQAKIGQLINHPFLIKNYCTLVDNKNIYHLTEYIEGQSLYVYNKTNFYGRQHIQRDALGLQKQSLSRIVAQISNIKQILHQLLEGLNYLHERGIIHRDLKPSNILITHKDTYKIGDFGTSIFCNSSEPIGTLDYAAPEIMLRQPYNTSIDMWSVGCIAYELYVGYPPFFNENRDTTVKKIIDCDYDCSNINDEDLINLISKLLQRKWEKRLTAKNALEHSFFKEFKQV